MKTKGLKIFLGIVACILWSISPSYGRTITVGTSGSGATYTDITGAVNAAQRGDTVLLLSDVTLNEDLSFSRSVVVMSRNGYAIKRKASIINFIFFEFHISNTSIYVNGNTEVEFLNVVLDCDNISSTTYNSYYSHYVSVNSGAVLKLNGSVIRNSSDAAPIAVSGTLIGGLITKNTSSEPSIGVVLVNSGGRLVNVVVASNVLDDSNVSAVNLNGGDMINCTVVGNNARSGSSNNRYAVNSSNNNCKITNCIIYGNGGSIFNKANVTYSCVQGGYSGRGNISANPLLNSDYSLRKESPCVDAGNTSAISSITDVDYFGRVRVSGPAVDMGATEVIQDYCEKTDTRISCGEPFVWIDGKTYTESNHTAKDTIKGNGKCDTIVTLDLTVYPPVDKSSLTEEIRNKIDCTGEEVTFSFDPSATGRTSFKWQSFSGALLGTSNTYTAVVGDYDMEYYFIASTPDGLCPDTTVFGALVNYDFYIDNVVDRMEDSVPNNGCFLKSLDLTPYRPIISYCSKQGRDTTYSYRLNDGPWVDFATTPVLSDVAPGDKVYWRVVVRTNAGSVLRDDTDSPMVIVLQDDQNPVLSCSDISKGKQVIPVSDSVNGIVPFSVPVDDVLSAASDNCSSSLKVLASLDGVTFIDFQDYTGVLNVFDAPSFSAYLKVEDNSGLQSDVCPVKYEVERATEVNGKMYAIVRDTMVCSLPLSWHGHTFTYDGEQAEVGAALLSVKVDSSFFVTERVVNVGPYTWRDGVTYTESVVVEDYHQPNANACDSVFTLRLTIKNPSNLSVDDPVSPIDSAMNEQCALSVLDLSTLMPGYVYSSDNAVDTTVYYKVNGGEWVELASAPFLSHVTNGTSLYWRVDITTDDHSIVSDETALPQVIRLSDAVAPTLDCERIAANGLLAPVSDSVMGRVTFSVAPDVVKAAASDNCSSDFTLYASTDGLSFSEYNGEAFPLNVFTQPTSTVYWRVADLAGNESSICEVEYGVERNTEVSSKKYAIVRDTLLCAGDLPFVWHGHTFTYADERAEVGAALLTVRIDSSYYVEETIVSTEPYTWRNGVTYDKSVRVEGFHQPNANGCDSVYALNLVVKSNNSLMVYEAVSPIDSAANDGCALRTLDLTSLVPQYVYNATNAVDTVVYYRVDGGEWVNLVDQPSLSGVVDKTQLHWRVVVNAPDTTLADETVNPQIIRVKNLTPPTLVCDSISVDSRFVAVADSVNGEVRFSVPLADVKGAASSECESEFDVLFSNDGLNFSPYNGLTFNLNVFTQTDRTLYWKVKDLSGNESDACSVDYSVERASEVEGKMYAIVRDTFVCAKYFPVVWHGHTFSAPGESAEVGAALLTVKEDNSFFRYDTVVVCGVSQYTWSDGNTYASGSSYDLSRTIDNGAGECDSVVYTHLVVHSRMTGKKTGDTVRYWGCYGVDSKYIGFTVRPTNEYNKYRWFEQGNPMLDEFGNVVEGVSRFEMVFNGLDNYEYKLIISASDGYCPDTTVYITNSTHFLETDSLRLMDLDADENCKANVRLWDYIPAFKDMCSFSFIDTVCYYNVNSTGERSLSRDDYYEFTDGDIIFWRVGYKTAEDSIYTISSDNFFQRVSVVDRTAPKVDTLGISYGNLVHPVADSVVGDVRFMVPLSDVTDHLSDNCDSVADLTLKYSYDGVIYEEFTGMEVSMNVYDAPTVTVYYSATDRAGNTMIDSVIYSIERNTPHGDDSFAVVRDTMLCPAELPFVWHGHSFAQDGDSGVVGAAHLTVHTWNEYVKYDTVVACHSYVWRDGVEYFETTTEPVTYVQNGEGICDSVVHLNLTILSPSYGEDTVVICVKDLPYDWNGYQLGGDSIVKMNNKLGCDSMVNVKVIVLPVSYAEIYDTACGSYTLNDSVYTQSGDYQQVFTSAVTGCDSILTLHLVVNPIPVTHQYETVCGSFTLNDSVYTKSGVYEQRLVSKVTGCDSVLTLHLTVLEHTYGKDTITVCQGMLPYMWHDMAVYGDTVMRLRNYVDCDSFVSIKLIERPIAVTELYDTACGSYALNGFEYIKSGTYEQRLTGSWGCDSVVRLNLTLLDESVNTIYVDACGSYTLNDSTYTESGVYEQHLTAANGCDSVLTLVLELKPAGDTLIKEITTGSYVLNDSVYTKSGLYTQYIPTSNGCDSIVRLDLTIVEGVVYEWWDTVCSAGIFWDNTLIKDPGTYSKHYVTERGEDSTSILHLTVMPTKYETIVDTAYSYYILNDSVYTKSGIYMQTLSSSLGCDSIITLNLKILNLVNGVVKDTVCSSFTLNDSVYTESGTYEQHLVTPDGRDSLLVLELVINPSYEVHLEETSCGAYTLNDSVYETSGEYEQRFQTAAGCDSVIKLKLTVLDVPVRVITDTVCDAYVLNDSVYRASGTYEQHVVSADGCDSLIKLNLTVLKSPLTQLFDTVCVSYRLNDSVYTESGIYEQRFPAMNGCDSIVQLNLIVLSSPYLVVYDTACVSYTANGEVYTEDAVLQKRVNSPSGCDSIITVHLTILPIKRDTIYCTSCDSLVLNDSVYTESGVYNQTLISSLGCDSILTVYLTILRPTYGKDTVDICENAPFVDWHGYEVSSDTTLAIKNSSGCDSIVAIHLNRLPVLRSEFADTSCAPYVWNDAEYNVSGDYDYRLTSSIGCDSIITLHLTILPSYDIYVLDSAVSYYEWNGERYDSSGIYTQHLVSSAGCDSVVTIGVTILPPPEKMPEKVNACISYEWQGRTLTQSGIYYDLLKTAAGEDSIVSIDLTINYPKYNKDTIHYTVCRNELPVVWNDYEISTDTARVVLTTVEGCDSFIVFRLNILPTFDTTTYVTTCDSFEWHGRYLYDTGLYTDTLQSIIGCDSITRLALTVKKSSVTKIRRTLCESELPVRWNEYEFYRDTLIVFPSANGCDSIIDVKLTVNKEYNLVYDEVTCGNFYWQGKLLKNSGVYVDSFTTASGCDSVVTLNLIVSHPYRVNLVDTTKAGTIYEKNGFTVDANHIGNHEYEVNLLSQYGCDSVVHLSLYVDGRDIKIKWTSVSGGASVDYGDKTMNRKFCAGDEYYLNYQILNGVPDTFKFFFDSDGIAQGFRNVVGTVEDGEVGSIKFTVPEGIAPGTYNVHAQMFGEGKSSKVETVPIRIGYDARYVMRMWNDVVVCDNSKNEFVSYQWKKNDRDIPGATGQYYCEKTGLDGYYSLHAITAKNDTMYVCGKYFEALDVPFSISTYPVYSNYGKVTVYVHGLKEEDLVGARMYVYTMEGVLKYWTDIVRKENEVWVTQGRYVCVVILSDDRRASCKFVSNAVELIK